MANLQGAPQQSTLVSSPTPAPSAPPPPAPMPLSRSEITSSQLTGVNVPEAALGGTPYKSITETDVAKPGDSRLEFYSPTKDPTAVATGKDREALPGISPRDDRMIDAFVQNEQGTTNRDILTRPDNYSDAIAGANYVNGGGVNGMSPTALAQSPTRGSKPTPETPSQGNSAIDQVLRESSAGRTGDKVSQGSTAMRANFDAQPGKKSTIVKAGEYAPYTPKEIRKASPADTIVPTTPTKPEAVVPAPSANPDTERMRALIRRQESGSFGGDYAAKAKSSSASGAYQFVDKTWRSAAKDAGVGAEYRHAYQAPKAVQDKVFDHYFGKLMDRTNGDFYKAVNIHFTGNPEGRLSAAGKKANPTINSQGYRSSIARHEAEYDKLKSTVATR